LTKPISIQDNDSFAKLWLHEATRVFADRLCTTEDINFFQELAIEILNQKFKVKWANKDKLFKQAADGLFSVILRVDSDNRLYEMVEKKAKLLSMLQDKLVDYNFSSSNKMDLVFFDDAIRHIIGILRILMQPRGNSMLIGVSGSGKQSLTRLAASILEHVCFQVKLSKNFKPSDFRDSLREKMLPSGNQAVDTTFILNDT
jgi:dynein heavy chain